MSDDGIQLQVIRSTQPASFYENQDGQDDGNGHLRHRTPPTQEYGKDISYGNQAYTSDHPAEDTLFIISSGPEGKNPPETVPVREPLVYEEEDEEEDGTSNTFSQNVTSIQHRLRDGYKKHEKAFKIAFYIVLLLTFAAYFVYAMYYHFGDEGSIRLLWVTCLVIFCVLLYAFFHFCWQPIERAIEPCTRFMSKHEEYISWIVVIMIFLFIIIFVIVDVLTVSEEPYNLVPASGIIVYVLLFYIFSHNPSRIR